jgi:hypothetical protein
MEEKRNAYRIFVGKPEGNRPLGRPRHRWVDSIKMDRIGYIWLRIPNSGIISQIMPPPHPLTYQIIIH